MAKTIENYISDINVIVELIKADIAGLGNLIPPAENNETLREIFNPENELITTILRSINSEIINPNEKFTLDRANTLNNRIKLYSAIVTGLVGGVGLAGSHSILSSVNLNKSDINLYKDEIDNFGNYYTMLLSMLPVAKFHAYLDSLGDISNGVIPFIHKLLDLNPYLFYNTEFTTKLLMYQKFWDVIAFKDFKVTYKFYLYFFHKMYSGDPLNITSVDLSQYQSVHSNLASDIRQATLAPQIPTQLIPFLNNTYSIIILEGKIIGYYRDIEEKYKSLREEGSYSITWKEEFIESDMKPKYGDLVTLITNNTKEWVYNKSAELLFNFNNDPEIDWISPILSYLDPKHVNNSYKSMMNFRCASDSIFNMIVEANIKFGLKSGQPLNNINSISTFITSFSLSNNLGLLINTLTSQADISTSFSGALPSSVSNSFKNFLEYYKGSNENSDSVGYIFNFDDYYKIDIKKSTELLLNSYFYKRMFISELIARKNKRAGSEIMGMLNKTFTKDMLEYSDLQKPFKKFIISVIKDLSSVYNNNYTSITSNLLDIQELYDTLNNFGGINILQSGTYTGKFMVFNHTINKVSGAYFTPKNGSKESIASYQFTGRFMEHFGFIVEGKIEIGSTGAINMLKL